MSERAKTQTARAMLRFCRERIAWHRFAVVLSVCIVVGAAVILYRMLRGIDVDSVLAAFWSIEPQWVALAAAAVAAGYFTLTFYDLFALRNLGLTAIPYSVAARGGFTSYAIGHSLGAATLTGAAVRLRVYSMHGLDSVAVAKVCFLAALTFWLGNVTVLGLGFALEPEAATAIDQLPVLSHRLLAGALLGAVAGYLGWVWRTPRSLGRGGWAVRLPNGPQTLLQIAIGVVDLVCCTLAMYMLLPSAPSIGFAIVGVVFVSAMLLGFASHAPGGIGVFEATMLLGLPELDREALLASLLLFRLLYHVAPLVLALLMLGTREIAAVFVAARHSHLPSPFLAPTTSRRRAAAISPRQRSGGGP
jgi:uncharacterized membrane protein YbhN (UPF0104 family)